MAFSTKLGASVHRPETYVVSMHHMASSGTFDWAEIKFYRTRRGFRDLASMMFQWCVPRSEVPARNHASKWMRQDLLLTLRGTI